MFDRVNVPCPKCGEVVEFQSQAGECRLTNFTLDNAPPTILSDIANNSKCCHNCGHTVSLQWLAMPKLIVA